MTSTMSGTQQQQRKKKKNEWTAVGAAAVALWNVGGASGILIHT